MRKLLIALFILLNANIVSANYEPNDWQKKAVLMLEEEKKIIEVMWAQDISLWVSMIDDGTRRDGYANYICNILIEAGKSKSDTVIVKIWDAAKIKNDLVEIGKANCNY